MIEDFEIFIPGINISYKVKGGINECRWDNLEYRDIFNSYKKGIRWSFQNKNIVFENFSEGTINGYVSTDWKYVLAIHYKTEGIEKNRNAIVYNADGSERLFLDPEKLLANHPKEKRIFYSKDLIYSNAKWLENSLKKVVLSVQVTFPDRLTEIWEVDPDTGEFGELLYRTMEK